MSKNIVIIYDNHVWFKTYIISNLSLLCLVGYSNQFGNVLNFPKYHVIKNLKNLNLK